MVIGPECSPHLRKPRNWFVTALVYALPLLLFLYGLKCVLTLHGTLAVGSRAVMRSFHLVTVHGNAALLTGLGYIAAAVFVALCVGDPPPESRRWFRRILRGVARWGGLVGMFWLWVRAGQLNGASPSWPELQWPESLLLLRLLGMCFGSVAVLIFLWAMFQREAVKRELFENGCNPVHVWWRPAAYWAPFAHGTAFRVIYRDRAGSLHKAYCAVYRSYLLSPSWGSRRVRWLRDEVVEMPSTSESWVVVDDAPVRGRPKNISADPDNLLAP